VVLGPPIDGTAKPVDTPFTANDQCFGAMLNRYIWVKGDTGGGGFKGYHFQRFNGARVTTIA
jgi:hypothetical protein